MCQDVYICAEIKAGIDGAVHRVQAIWDTKLTTEDWGFLLVDTKKLSTRSIELEFCGQFIIYGRLELVSFLIDIVIGHHLFCGTAMGWIFSAK